jgi:NitT/TauT family transport system substrate-binding protein
MRAMGAMGPTGKRMHAAAAAAALTMLAAGCAAPGAPPAASGGDSCKGKTVSVGVTKSASDAPFYVAEDKGYFADEGLKIRFMPFDSAAKMIAPLGSGQLDVGAGAPSAGFYNAVARDVKLRIVADKGSMPAGHGYMPLMVRKDLYDSGKVKHISDLKGRKVAEPAQGTATSSTAAVMLKHEGLDYDDVKHEYIGFPEHVTAYGNKAVDAGLTTEPSASIAEKRGTAVRLATPPDFYKNQQLAVLLYGGAFAAKNSKAGTCFMRAYLRGARDYTSAISKGKVTAKGSGDVVRSVSRATRIDPDLYRSLVANYVHPDGKVNVSSLRRDYDFFRKQGWTEGKVSVGSLVDTSFAEAAVKKLGPYHKPGS